MAKNFYDLDYIRGISILEVCSAFGVKVDRAHKCKIRSEKTPSVQLYTNNSNGEDSFYDFGGGYGGDVINFVARLTDSDWQTALERLADEFGVEPINNTDYQKRNELSDSQYSKIGIYGDLATKNLDIDLERYSIESAQKYSDKYNMSVNELRKQYPEFYTYKILMRRALPFVSELRNNYYTELYNCYQLSKSLNITDPTRLRGSFIKKFEKLKDELVMAERLLKRASKGTSLEESITSRKYDIHEDYQAIIDGKISFQIGITSYNEIKQQGRVNDEIVHYRSVDKSTYDELLKYFLYEVPHAAFLKGEKVNMAFLPENSLVIDNAIETLKVSREIDATVSREKAVASDKSQNQIVHRMER